LEPGGSGAVGSTIDVGTPVPGSRVIVVVRIVPPSPRTTATGSRKWLTNTRWCQVDGGLVPEASVRAEKKLPYPSVWT
jgi:hypothetical protein